ncbi:hypothetical protein GCM10009603_43240 [Nocardiopsis exhalans]
MGYVPDQTAHLEQGPHPDFQAAQEHVSGTHLHVGVQVDHPVSDSLELGEVVELLAKRLGGALPSVWGVAEPLGREWSTADVIALARNRVPGQTRMLFSAQPAAPVEEGVRPFAGELRVARTESGVSRSDR